MTATATPISSGSVQAGLGMPDRDMYLLNEPNLVALRAAYLDHLTKMLTLAGETNAAARAKAILDFETDDRQGVAGPARTAATRPRPTTR